MKNSVKDDFELVKLFTFAFQRRHYDDMIECLHPNLAFNGPLDQTFDRNSYMAIQKRTSSNFTILVAEDFIREKLGLYYVEFTYQHICSINKKCTEFDVSAVLKVKDSRIFEITTQYSDVEKARILFKEVSMAST